MIKSTKIYTQRINQVTNFVNDNLDRSIPLAELAKIACFSPFHFHRIFVAITGESVNFFTNRLRLEKAARLLNYSKESISTIGIQCGFSSPATFSRSFKQYFGISPSHYQKTGEIENSKICKELFPMNDYLVPMTTQELQTAFPVEIIKAPKRKVAYIRVVNAYEEGLVLKAYEVMIKWAKENNVFDSGEIFGMSIDDPMITPKEKYRYEVCITLPDNYAMNADQQPVEIMTLPACQYGVTTVHGDIMQVATATHYLFSQWLVSSSYEPEHLHGLEIFLDKEKIMDWSHFDLKLCIPIKSFN